MAQAQNKTRPTQQRVGAYIATLAPEAQQTAKTLVKIFQAATQMQPVMWGSIVGFGSYHYQYDSGREGDFLATGFAMRKSGPTIYIMPGYNDYHELLKQLGPHQLGKSCLYLKRLDDVDHSVLKKLIKAGLRDLKKKYPITKT